MKNLFSIFALCFFSATAFAADYWTMTGVMAAYPGIVNNPFSAPIINDARYKSETDCDNAINQISQSHPLITAIDKGRVLPPQETAGGWVAVAATCLKHTE